MRTPIEIVQTDPSSCQHHDQSPDHCDFSRLAMERNERMNHMLLGFNELTKMYTFGGSRIHHNNSLDNLINQNRDAKRASVVASFMFNKPFNFGPKSNSAAIQAQISEGEESEIDITDLSVMPSLTGKREDLLSSGAINSTANSEGKGGPRVSDVVEIMVDLNFLKEIKNVGELPCKADNKHTYMTLQGVENN